MDDKELSEIVNQLLYPYKGVLESENVDGFDDIKVLHSEQRDYLIQLNDTQNGKSYWLKSYQTMNEKTLLPLIKSSGYSFVIAETDHDFLERHSSSEILGESLRKGDVSVEKATDLVAGFLRFFHNMRLAYGHELERHLFYEEGYLKVTDFATLAPGQGIGDICENYFIDVKYAMNFFNKYSGPDATRMFIKKYSNDEDFFEDNVDNARLMMLKQ